MKTCFYIWWWNNITILYINYFSYIIYNKSHRNFLNINYNYACPIIVFLWILFKPKPYINNWNDFPSKIYYPLYIIGQFRYFSYILYTDYLCYKLNFNAIRLPANRKSEEFSFLSIF